MYTKYYFLVILFFAISYFVANFLYNRTSYANITHKSMLQMYFDAGSRGEFHIFRELSFLEKKGGRFLFNVYLPYNDYTTEIDILLLYPSGIYVFESKNYSGWIFGTAKSKTWTQALPTGRGRSAHKEKFLNPLFQNALHLKQLKAFCKIEQFPCFSVVVFSDDCTFKSQIDAVPPEYVCHTRDLTDVFAKINRTSEIQLSAEQIQTLFDLLYPCSQYTDKEKQEHIECLNERHTDDDSK